MSKKNKIAILFGDMTEDGQKKVVAQGAGRNQRVQQLCTRPNRSRYHHRG